MSEKFLVVKLDQYAGNVDEIVSVALTGVGADRYGDKQAQKVFDAKMKPLLDKSEDYDEYNLPVEFSVFSTEYGYMPYALDNSSTNNLRFGIDSYTTDEDVEELLEIWERAYGDDDLNLVITVEDIHGKTVTVKVLGLDVVETIEQRHTIW